MSFRSSFKLNIRIHVPEVNIWLVDYHANPYVDCFAAPDVGFDA